ncbi:MAG: bifunctional pyr operon transcriptional regulator/uracil phosphoribosyltransferase, partial [Actinomycetota bacterium]|nr:bifunctional pyr operon transcriptional regulator/uracil phosphoribosyltransferase [Actinomycetota bacterium]
MPRTTVMEPADLQRAAWRMAHEILERNRGTGGLVVIGLQKGGVWVAERLAGIVAEVAGEPVP